MDRVLLASYTADVLRSIGIIEMSLDECYVVLKRSDKVIFTYKTTAMMKPSILCQYIEYFFISFFFTNINDENEC